MGKKATMELVARTAGVSRATVSLVARKSPLVASETRARVERVMADLDYVADAGAARLRSKKSRTIGLVVPNLVNPFFTDFLSGAELATGEDSRVVLLANSNDDPVRQTEILQRLRSHAVDGVILCPAEGTDPDVLGRLQEWELPIIQSLREVGERQTDYAGADYVRGMELAVEHLVGCGHQRVAFISVSAKTSAREERLKGFGLALAKYGTEVMPIIEVELSIEGAVKAAEMFLAMEGGPTAAICFNDYLAAAFMHGLRRGGINPGKDCAVVGLDDLRLSELTHPSLTTVAMHPAKVGAEAVRLLTRRIHEADAPLVRTLIDPALMIRSSSMRGI